MHIDVCVWVKVDKSLLSVEVKDAHTRQFDHGTATVGSKVSK